MAQTKLKRTRDWIPNPRGPAPMEPTQLQRQTVLILAGMSVPFVTIAQNLNGIGDGIDPRTLKAHFAHELEAGKGALIASLKGKVVSAAMNGSVRAQTWLLERLDPEQFAPRYRRSDDDLPGYVAPPIESDGPAKVEIYLPDNGRTNSDWIDPAARTIDVEKEKD